MILLLFALLVYFTSKWAVFDSDELQAKTENRRPLIASQQIPRGSITTSDGVLIAESNPQGGGTNPVYIRDYPEGPLFGNPVGYSFVNVGQTGDRALRERAAHRGEERVRVDHRPAPEPGPPEGPTSR